MTRRSRAKSSSLFLLELILAIVIFSIASAVCVQFFVKSHLLSRGSRALELSVNEVASIAEIISVSTSLESSVDAILALDTQSDSFKSVISAENLAGREQTDIKLYYNENFISCGENDATYIIYVTLLAENQMLTADLKVTPKESAESIYSLSLSHHLQRRASNE